MKNDHHFMVCAPNPEENREYSINANIQIKLGNSAMEPKIVDGDKEALKKWAEDYIVKGSKICIAVPYTDARKVIKSKKVSWFANLISTNVSTHQLIIRKGITYLTNSEKPFSGKVKDIFNNGQISYEGKYKSGLKSGSFITYYNNGQVKKQANFIKGNIEGKVEEFHKNGNIKRRIEYKNGILDGVVENFREDGKLIHMETWKDKDLHGFFKTYDEKYGSVSTGYFNNRHESGEWKTYDKNGVLVSKLVFDDKGNLISKEENENEEYYKIFQFDKKE